MTALFVGPDVRVVPDPALRVIARPVEHFDAQLRRLVHDMFRVMRAARGVGLAANQIGVDLAVFVMDCAGVRAVMVNPVLVAGADPTVGGPVWQEGPEGCLSVPGDLRMRRRLQSARVVGQDLDGGQSVIEGVGLVARCLQHETDHVKGKLFTDPMR